MKVPTIVGGVGALVFFLGVVIGWFGFPKLLNSQIAANVVLKKGSDIRQMWEKFPDPLDFKVYLFNVTNPMEVQEGEKPILKEIGPYFYDEYKEKESLQDHMKNDSVSYNQRVKWFFNPAKSGAGLTGEELITMPHLIILGMVMTIERDKPGMLGLINKAIPHIYGNPTSIFMTAPAKNILFEGVIINCTVKDFSAKAVCAAMKKEGKDFQMVSDTVYKFSVFGHKNGTLDPARLTVKRGIQNVSELGRVVNFKGEAKQSVWRGDPCNNFTGTDSTIFPPFLKPEDGIVAFAPDLCRSIAAVFERRTVYRGIPGNRYTASLGDQSSDPSEKCFCLSDTQCLKKGAMDLTPCQGAPIVVTLPHFYLTHEDYQAGVEGLTPTQDQHQIVMEFEPITGTPLGARKRLQFNMFLHRVEKLDLFAEVPTALFPLFWVEEGLELDQKYVDKLESSLFRTLRIMDAIKWIMMAVGLIIGAAGVYLYMKRKNDLSVDPVPARPNTKPLSIATVNGDGMGRY